jgi:hypothetical protein
VEHGRCVLRNVRPYLELLRQAAAERGYEARQRRIEGDFTQVADGEAMNRHF